MNTQNRSSRLSRYVLVGTAAVVIGSGLLYGRLNINTNAGEPQATPVRLRVDDRPVQRDGKLPSSFAPIVKKVLPSVVIVSTVGKAPTHSALPLPEDPFLRRFFGEDGPGGGAAPDQYMPRPHGMGSGVIVTSDGYILTNNHVVEDAQNITVTTHGDAREFKAKVVGRDPRTDIAVLKVDAKGLPAIEVANSDNLEIGDLVLALGNPFGVGQSVTMGMVSGLGRGSVGLDYEDFIQTDAAINPGNSGGALVDADGRLVGINTAILSRTGGNNGIGFAVPINLAGNVMESLIEHGKVVRGFMGVSIQTVTPSLAKQFKLADAAGALVSEVSPNSPAEKAGIQSGDVVVELNGKPVRGSRQLQVQVAQAAPGSKVSLKVLREGEYKEVSVKLKEAPEPESIAQRTSSKAAEEESFKGVTVADLTDGLRRRYSIPKDVEGAVVTNVQPSSAAFEAGLRPGDVIREINRKRVKSAEEAVEASDSTKDETILLKLWSQGGSRFIVVDESKAG